MHSHQTKNPKKWGADATQSDVILDVKDIEKFGKKLKVMSRLSLFTMDCMT